MRQQINLYHPIFRKETKRFSAMAMVQALGFVALGAALLYGYSFWQVHHVRLALQAQRQTAAAAAERLATVQHQFGGGTYAVRLHALQQEMEEQKALAVALTRGGLGNTQGYSRYLDALAAADRPGLWITAFSAKGEGDAVQLTGQAVNAALIPEYLSRLAQQPAFSGMTFGSFEVTRPHPWHGYVAFQVARNAAEAKP